MQNDKIRKSYIKVKWQDGTIKENGRNGADIRDVLSEAFCKTKEFNNAHPCEENIKTMNLIREAISQQYLRTVDRKKRGVEGEYLD